MLKCRATIQLRFVAIEEGRYVATNPDVPDLVARVRRAEMAFIVKSPPACQAVSGREKSKVEC